MKNISLKQDLDVLHDFITVTIISENGKFLLRGRAFVNDGTCQEDCV